MAHWLAGNLETEAQCSVLAPMTCGTEVRSLNKYVAIFSVSHQ